MTCEGMWGRVVLYSIVRFCYIERNHFPSTGTRAPREEERRGGLGLPESTYRCHDADVSAAGRRASGLAGATATHHPHTHDDENEGDSTADHRQHARVERTHARAVGTRGRGRRHEALLALAGDHNVPVLTLRTLSCGRHFVTFDAVFVDYGAFPALVRGRALFVRTVRTIRMTCDISSFYQHVVISTVHAVIFTIFRDTYCGVIVARLTLSTHLQQPCTVVK